MSNENHQPEVTRVAIFSMQVCVPEDWTDDQVVEFAECQNPANTESGWFIRCEGDPNLKNDPERNPCDDREGFVHITLDV